MLTAKTIIQDLAHLFFPHICAGCGSDELDAGTPLCMVCMAKLPFTNFHAYAGNPVEKCFWGRMKVDAATALFHFTDGSLVQQLLHQLKYRGNASLGLALGEMMGGILAAAARFDKIDMLVPLPLFAAREKKRGYNQAVLLCEGMTKTWAVPSANKALKRLSATETQTRKGRADRWQNMQGRFTVAAPEQLTGKHVLLVDDVITTGATLEACGQEILALPGTRLSVAALAYTV